MDTLEKVIEIVAETCDVEKSEVNENSTVGDFPAWDSVGHLSILSPWLVLYRCTLSR